MHVGRRCISGPAHSTVSGSMSWSLAVAGNFSSDNLSSDEEVRLYSTIMSVLPTWPTPTAKRGIFYCKEDSIKDLHK